MFARGLAPSTMLVAVALAGCLGGGSPDAAEPPQPVHVDPVLHKLGHVVEILVPLADGLRIHGTVYLPEVPEGTKVPAVLDLGPYYGNLNAETNAYNTNRPPNSLYAYFLEHGYAVALVSLRGTGLSEGCFKIGGPEEEQDAAAVVEHLAAQPWSNGAVAMTGVSYDGTTPWEGAVTGTPSLKAIVPVEGISDMYRYSFAEGVPIGGGHLFNTYYLALVDAAYTDPDGLSPWALSQRTNVCPETADVLLQGYETYLDGVHGPFWDERDSSAKLASIRAATFVVHGLQDWNVKPDHVQTVWQTLPEPKRMLLGQWEHNIPWRNSYNRDWNYAAYNDTIRQWLDAFLLEDADARAAALAAPPVVVQDSSGSWWNFTSWPPPESVSLDLFLAPGGRLVPAAGNGSGAASFRTYPGSNFAGSTGDATGLAPLGATRALFRSTTLDDRRVLMGNPTITVTVSVDEPGGYLAASLYDESPQGTLTRVTPGYVSLAQRQGRDQTVEVPVNSAMTVDVPLYATAHAFEPGHRIVVALSGDEAEMASTKWAPHWTVHLGPDATNLVRLPLLSAAVRDPAPSDEDPSA